jgi:chromosome segregation ATPase
MEKASPKSPDNIENYLDKTSIAKQELADITAKIWVLEAERVQLEAGNAEVLQSLKDKITAKLKEAEETLISAKQKEAEAEAKLVDVANKHGVHNEKAKALDSAIVEFHDKLKSNAEVLKGEHAAIEQQKEKNATIAISLSERQVDYDKKKKELDLNVVEYLKLYSQQEDVSLRQQAEEKKLTALRLSLEIDAKNLKDSIDAQDKKFNEDLAELKTLSEKIESEKKENKAILDEIKQRNNRMQMLVISQKSTLREIETQRAVSQAIESNVREQTIVLQALKDELGTEKPQEAAK